MWLLTNHRIAVQHAFSPKVKIKNITIEGVDGIIQQTVSTNIYIDESEASNGLEDYYSAIGETSFVVL